MPNLLEIKSLLKVLLSNIFFSFDLNLNGLKIIVRKTPNKTNEMDIKYILLKSKRISSLENNDKIIIVENKSKKVFLAQRNFLKNLKMEHQ